MLNEFVYCPRLAVLEWVDGEWAESDDTVGGSIRHTAVNRPGYRVRRSLGRDQEAFGRERIQLRSVALSDVELGLTAKIDRVEGSRRSRE
ncbi:MAG: hypothetical protein ACE5FG_13565 [Myxococcota bacterium]